MQPTITAEYLASQGLSKNGLEHFWNSVNKNGPIPSHVPHLGKCWIWTAFKDRDGYGRMGRKLPNGEYRPIIATHVSMILNVGPVPCGMCVLHHCDNASCVNPEHLWIGTIFQNVKDRVSKNRTASGERHWVAKYPEKVRRCEKHHMAKLNWESVNEIRQLKKNGTNTVKQLAKTFGVATCTIQRIIKGVLWNDKHMVSRSRDL